MSEYTKTPPSEEGFFWLKHDGVNKVMVKVVNYGGKYRFTSTGVPPGISVDVVSSGALWLKC